MRTQQEMPSMGQSVVIMEEASALFGKRGKVVNIQKNATARAYTVQVGKVTRKFRAGDVFRPNQLDWN